MSVYALTLGERPTRIDLSVHAGDPIDQLIEVRDALGVLVPGGLVGWTATVEVVSVDGAPVASLTPVLDALGLSIVATPVQTTAWFNTWPRECRWQIRAAHPDGEPIFRASGWVLLYP